MSAPLATSNTSVKPIFLSASRTMARFFRCLNWLYRDGAGSAMGWIYSLMIPRLSVTAIFA